MKINTNIDLMKTNADSELQHCWEEISSHFTVYDRYLGTNWNVNLLNAQMMAADIVQKMKYCCGKKRIQLEYKHKKLEHQCSL